MLEEFPFSMISMAGEAGEDHLELSSIAYSAGLEGARMGNDSSAKKNI